MGYNQWGGNFLVNSKRKGKEITYVIMLENQEIRVAGLCLLEKIYTVMETRPISGAVIFLDQY